MSCADPCFDDGLAQGGCPEEDTDSDAGGQTGTETDGNSATQADGTETDSDSLDDTAGSGGGGGQECPVLEEVLLPQTPTVQLIVDQSGSMNEDFGSGTRWEAMEETLVGPDGVVTQLQSSIRFGLSLFRSTQGVCPDVQSIGAQLDGADEISTLLDMEDPGGETPTGESFEIVTDEVLSDPWEGDKVIVLVTDGEPDTCDVPDPETDEEIEMTRGRAVSAVSTAFESEIRTFVIGVSTGIAEDHLQDLANAGVGVEPGEADAPFYVANDPEALVLAFDAIVAGLRPCTFGLAMPLDGELAPTCEVMVNDEAVPFEGGDGWTLVDPSTIELQGTACDSIQQGVVSVRMQCACEL